MVEDQCQAGQLEDFYSMLDMCYVCFNAFCDLLTGVFVTSCNTND